MNRKENYEELELEIIEFEAEDIATVSVSPTDPDEPQPIVP